MSTGLRGVLLEAATVLVAGLLVGVLANFASPRGLELERDYFPELAESPVSPVTQTNAIVARLRANGLQPLAHKDVLPLFQDPKRELELFVFVDVRDDEHYAAGHIPGAYHFDYYRPEAGLAEVLAVCETAEKIVIYCNGGDCDDSQFAALLLTQGGVPRERLFVYLGGFTEWSTNNLAVELGARASGVMRGEEK